jgi:magnesium-transporting ATPase (P-type)
VIKAIRQRQRGSRCRRRTPLAQPVDAVLAGLATTSEGLASSEIERRLAAHGRNGLEEDRTIRPATVLLRQFRSTLIYILIFIDHASFDQ